MTSARFLTASDAAIINGVLASLRADIDVQAVFGTPARIYDGEAPQPAYPFAQLEQHDSKIADSVVKRGLEHTLQIATYSRQGGFEEAKSTIGVLRGAVERMTLDLPGQRVVFVLPLYCDVLRTKSPNIMRGLLRLRLQSEAV